MRNLKILLTVCLCFFFPALSFSGEQKYEVMSASTQLLLQQKLSSPAASVLSEEEKSSWLAPALLEAIPANMPEPLKTQTILTVLYEAKRAGLDPLLVVAVMDVESRFRKYAVSSAGARGLMQVMPFWLDTIGSPGHNLFDSRTNIRYGCVILRFYIDIENGNLTNALARYNGSLGKQGYPNAVFAALEKWKNNLAPGGKLYARKD